ncbi:formiminotetrahydrofolate cyclodeaminase [Parabacteroides sp. PF5-5]|uniref:cyclodeaminase/cyclohydrolase family protein n=1 Tax=unclassified Parabacteroides TaxID=2649774 RepID=UPI0024741E26|nr:MULTISPECIES: cyclodeaminase/cyclohydrolase family protein [unclassified Parabacteroides]MDH6304978.1 formiminotetrahydrofolate cyclodeaminase [Parabacteroides sp. PH5-39]MDH6315937.1 formiminotetrahydrofolate cyclodeaminase [Parabacteroides sp. PF5-13]MDH6319594.1 formiminotetrahydrofolate cyclodeaminase [Parabacteroides sp. PH5-13]MDH6323325.1 formiminotetrahydrofolate cyclodeaminase [Parabacteroides sp. PH5-8]MDH6327167.1 formiminotetrahydrofolate cyclodeaminase [Parabacteroides sp. PH5-
MLADLTIKEFLAKTAGSDPVPGGGSISALNGAIALALAEMVANLTVGKKKYAEVENDMLAITAKTAPLRQRLIEYIDKDSEAYDRVFAAFKLPKETDEQMAVRSQTIQEATKDAARIPMMVAEEVFGVMDTIAYVAEKGNQNAVTDACVAMMAARTAVLGALLNVRINLSSIKDEIFVREMTERADTLEKQSIEKEQLLLNKVKEIL